MGFRAFVLTLISCTQSRGLTSIPSTEIGAASSLTGSVHVNSSPLGREANSSAESSGAIRALNSSEERSSGDVGEALEAGQNKSSVVEELNHDVVVEDRSNSHTSLDQTDVGKSGPRVISSIQGWLRLGEGRGYCLELDGQGLVRVRVSRSATRRNASRTLLPRLRSSRDHCYCGVFALDIRRDAIAESSESTMVSTRKLRHDDELVWSGEVPLGGCLHVLVASNAVDEGVELGYAIEVSCPEGSGITAAIEVPGDGLGWRGVGESVERVPAAPRRLLCLDGGGARGVVPLAVLAKLEKAGSRRARERFELFAGTSTGAIIAAALAIAELPVPVVQQVYDDMARLIFGSKGLSRLERAARLRAVLSAVFGAEAVLFKPGAVTSYRPRCLIVTTDASTQRMRPRLYRNYAAADDDEDDPARPCRIVDALLASAAAPPFFPAMQLGHRRILDGALVANNPTLFALLETASLGRDVPELVVSLGTGVAPLRATRATGFHSHLDFAEALFGLLTDTDATHDLVKRHLESKRRSTKHTRYHRLDAILDASHLRLDEGDERALRTLRSMALDYLQREKTHDWTALVRELRGDPKDDLPTVYDIDVVAPRPHSDSWLRPFRKRAARITGMHGFFSNKPYRAFVQADPPSLVEPTSSASDQHPKQLQQARQPASSALVVPSSQSSNIVGSQLQNVAPATTGTDRRSASPHS